MSADRLLTAKIYQLVNEEDWNLDGALHEYSNVRHDMVAVLQPRSMPSGRTTNEEDSKDSENGRHRGHRGESKGKGDRKEKAKAKAKEKNDCLKIGRNLGSLKRQLRTARRSLPAYATTCRSAPRRNVLSLTAALCLMCGSTDHKAIACPHRSR